jgi:hypothetical protein
MYLCLPDLRILLQMPQAAKQEKPNFEELWQGLVSRSQGFSAMPHRGPACKILEFCTDMISNRDKWTKRHFYKVKLAISWQFRKMIIQPPSGRIRGLALEINSSCTPAGSTGYL